MRGAYFGRRGSGSSRRQGGVTARETLTLPPEGRPQCGGAAPTLIFCIPYVKLAVVSLANNTTGPLGQTRILAHAGFSPADLLAAVSYVPQKVWSTRSRSAGGSAYRAKSG